MKCQLQLGGLSRYQLRQTLAAFVAIATTALTEKAAMAATVLLMQYRNTTMVHATTAAAMAAACEATGAFIILPYPSAVDDNAAVQ